MCGFAGIYDPSSKDSSEDLAHYASLMSSTLRHRGPNDEGVWADDIFAVGHRRLSVQDLSKAGSQPMRSHSDRYVIAFNGEIYNKDQLRDVLNSLGKPFQWRGHSDTEILLEYIAFFGLTKALVDINGMFAFALWDREERQLYLARDRFGEKPLYWGWSGESIVFSSELKAIRKHIHFSHALDDNSVSKYFRYSYVPAPWSIFKGIYKLEPSTFLAIKGIVPKNPPPEPIAPSSSFYNISIERYYDLKSLSPEDIKSKSGSFPYSVNDLQNALEKCVINQMGADVPIGAFLSGGIDSSLIVSLMQKNSTSAINTYTIGFLSDQFDEAPYAAEVASILGTKHNEHYLSSDESLSLISELPIIYDEPFADSSQIPSILISKIASTNITVALSGDGGDELFGGYPRYISGPKQMRYLELLPYSLRRKIGKASLSILENKLIQSFNNNGNSQKLGLAIEKFLFKAIRLSERFIDVENIEDMNKDMSSIWHRTSNLLPGIGYEEIFSENILDSSRQYSERMMISDLSTYLPDDLLCKMDRASMRHGLEVRMPFLDPKVVDIAFKMPMNKKIKASKTKMALRQILYKFLPEQLVDRPKTGFSVPIGDLLRGPLLPWANDLFSRSSLNATNCLCPDTVHSLWSQHLSGNYDRSNQLWTVLMFLSWLKV